MANLEQIAVAQTQDLASAHPFAVDDRAVPRAVVANVPGAVPILLELRVRCGNERIGYGDPHRLPCDDSVGRSRPPERNTGNTRERVARRCLGEIVRAEEAEE